MDPFPIYYFFTVSRRVEGTYATIYYECCSLLALASWCWYSSPTPKVAVSAADDLRCCSLPLLTATCCLLKFRLLCFAVRVDTFGMVLSMLLLEISVGLSVVVAGCRQLSVVYCFFLFLHCLTKVLLWFARLSVVETWSSMTPCDTQI